MPFPLSMRDVDLGFAGRQPPNKAIHAALNAITTGSALVLEAMRPGARLLTQHGIAVGRLSSSCRLPTGHIVSATVDSLVWRTREVTPLEYRNDLRCEGWWVVLATLVIDPDRVGSRLEAARA